MNIRAYLHERKEYIRPKLLHVTDPNYFQEMISFYSVLEGYRLKGLTISIDEGSGVEDESGDEIFTNDLVKVTYFDKSYMIRDREVEEGWVEFNDLGSFVITNEDGLIWELSNVMMGDDLFKLEIQGRR